MLVLLEYTSTIQNLVLFCNSFLSNHHLNNGAVTISGMEAAHSIDDDVSCSINEIITAVERDAALKSPVHVEEKEGAGKASAGGTFAKLSKEQLLEYTKKQKREIKRLNAELTERKRKNAEPNPAHYSAKNADSFDLFWELLPRRPPWQQRLARVSLSSLLTLLSSRLRTAQCSLRAAFYQWTALAVQSRFLAASDALGETRASNTHLEQRFMTSRYVMSHSLTLFLTCAVM